MRIVVLDGYTLNPGDLRWDALQALGPCEIHDRTAAGELWRRSERADILITNKAPLDRQLIQSIPGLRYIGVSATGTNIVDLVAATERGVPVTHVPAYGTNSVAQATMALLLELTFQVGHHAQTVREGRWCRSPDFSYWDGPLIELAGLTLGVIGLGRIGRAVSSLARAFGMPVIGCGSKPAPVGDLVRWVDLKSVFTDSDVVSLHCPLTAQTRLLVNAERLSWMKPTAFLLNTSRGALIDEPALADALNHGRLAGAGLDVLTEEPPRPDNPLLKARNCLITPHYAWATRAARGRLMRVVVENVRAFLEGRPHNVVNSVLAR